MATAQALREIESEIPWLRTDFRAGLGRLSDSVAEQSRRFAADMVLLAELTAQVPRVPMDERGATPWTSFRREVAVARKLSDQGAAAEIRAAVALTTCLPRTLELLHQGRVTVPRARALVTELEGVDDAVARLVDTQLADRLGKLSQARIKSEARRAILTADPDEAARRTAQHNDGRDVIFLPDSDDQASIVISGPALPAARMFQTLDQRARALKAAGDPRTLSQLRFDLAVTSYPCVTHSPTDPTAPATSSPAATRTADPRLDAEQVAAAAAVVAGAGAGAREQDTDERLARDSAAAAFGLRPSFVEPASSDCRMSRPVKGNITVPVETSLGLSNEPGWLDGYGWLSAPTCRLLLVDAELRRVCVQAGTGQLVDVADRDLRPPPTYTGLRHALMDLVIDDITLTSTASRTEDQHDPSPPLRQLVQLRDRFDDGPTGSMRRARNGEIDHDTPWPAGPTAAWNLVARATRTHQLKHYGWTPLRTPTSTLWLTPAGQVVEVPRHQPPPPGIDHHNDNDNDEPPFQLPDAQQLAATDLAQLQPFGVEDHRPWLTGLPKDNTTWTWLAGSDDLPF